jgi:hypothetical protein
MPEEEFRTRRSLTDRMLEKLLCIWPHKRLQIWSNSLFRQGWQQPRSGIEWHAELLERVPGCDDSPWCVNVEPLYDDYRLPQVIIPKGYGWGFPGVTTMNMTRVSGALENAGSPAKYRCPSRRPRSI